jgi:uncharacterized protein
MAEVVVRNDPDNDRYTAEVNGELAGFTVYQMSEGTHVFVHTKIDPSYSGMGVGSTLIRETLDDVRSQGSKIVPICPFVASFVQRHPEYLDMVDRELWKRIRATEPSDQ